MGVSPKNGFLKIRRIGRFQCDEKKESEHPIEIVGESSEMMSAEKIAIYQNRGISDENN